MKPFAGLMLVFFGLLGSGAGIARAGDRPAPAENRNDSLRETISRLDTAVFDAFNHCSTPGELSRHAAFFAPDVEFYHDTGGVTWTRDAMIANTRKNVCGHFSRELVPGSLKVYPIKDFGAIELGVHRFCQFQSGDCEGMADFTIIWRLQKGRWQITRVLSYGHRSRPDSESGTSLPPPD